MGRRIIGALVVAGCVALATVVLGAVPAGAGGGTYLRGDRESYEPGDLVHLSADVAKLDRDWYGPYTVELVSYGGVVPGSEAGIPVGRLVVTRLDERIVRAEVTFVLPKLANGGWMIQVRSARPLGDLSNGGILNVGPLPPPTTFPPPTTSAPTTVVATARPAIPVDAPPTTLTPPSSAAPSPPSSAPTIAAPDGAPATTAPVAADELRGWLGGAAAVLVAAAAVVLLARRASSRRVVTSPPADRVDDGPGEAILVELAPDGTGTDEPIGAGR